MTPDTGRGALGSILAELPARVPVERLDRLWIFPARPLGKGESGLVVLATLPSDPDDETRRVLTLRYRTERGKRGIERSDELAEQGSAPADRIDRVIEGVIRRLGDDSGEPAAHEIRGDPQRWADLLESLGEPVAGASPAGPGGAAAARESDAPAQPDPPAAPVDPTSGE